MENYLYSELVKEVAQSASSSDENIVLEAYCCSKDMLLLIKAGIPQSFILGNAYMVELDKELDIEKEMSFWSNISEKSLQSLKQKGITVEYIITPLMLEAISKQDLTALTYADLVEFEDMAEEFGMPEALEIFDAEISKRYPYAHLSEEEIQDMLIDESPEIREKLEAELKSRYCYKYSFIRSLYLSDDSWKKESREDLESKSQMLGCFCDLFLSRKTPIAVGEDIDFFEAFFIHFDVPVKNIYSETLLWLGAAYDILNHMKEKFGINLPPIEDAIHISCEDWQKLPTEQLQFFYDAYSYRPDVYTEDLKSISIILSERV